MQVSSGQECKQSDSLTQRLLQGVLALLLVFLPAGAAHADADQPAWFSTPYPYVLVEQDLRSAMDEFGQHLNLTVVFSEQVRGKSRGTVRASEAGEFLQNLCDANGLSWYFDGNVLYLNRADEITTRLFSPDSSGVDALRHDLNQLAVFGQRLAMRASESGDALLVSGPPAYLALVQQHLAQNQRPATVASAPRSHGIRVFRGNRMTQESP